MPFSPQGGNGTVLAPSDVVAVSANFEDIGKLNQTSPVYRYCFECYAKSVVFYKALNALPSIRISW